MERKQLAPGVFITSMSAAKFNRCRITIHLRFPAKRETATDAAVLALVLERDVYKRQAYLNTIPLTGIVCGMEAGANEYFGKHVEDLTLSECAILASITKNPTKYNPFTNPEQLMKRRNHVLYEMYNQGYITENEYNSATAETIKVVESKGGAENVTRTSNNSYFTCLLYTS